MSALITATVNGRLAIVKVLLENKCDINLQNRNGINALIAASFGGHLNIVNLLISKKCDLDRQSFDGNSALMDACQKGHIGIAVALTKAGCNANLVNKKGKTAMEILVSRHPTLVAKFYDLLDGSNDNATASTASKPVKRKVEETSNQTKKKESREKRPIIHVEMRPSPPDEDGENISQKHKKIQEVKSVSPGPEIVHVSDETSSFITATMSGDFNKVKNDLKANPALINCKDRDGMTALAWASMKGHMDIVQLLLTYENCQLDCQDRFGTTGLILACCSGNIDIAIKLLQCACDHTITDGKGKSAYDYLCNLYPSKCTSFEDALKI